MSEPLQKGDQALSEQLQRERETAPLRNKVRELKGRLANLRAGLESIRARSPGQEGWVAADYADELHRVLAIAKDALERDAS